MRCLTSTCLLPVLLFATPGSTQDSGQDTFSMALTGDSIITRKLSPYREPQFLEMIEMIRNADMAFTNLEMLFHDYEPYPAHQSGGTWMRGDPVLAKELVWAGFDMVARANNHTGDYGVLGMQLTTKYVEEAGLVHAGTGDSLPEAQADRGLPGRAVPARETVVDRLPKIDSAPRLNASSIPDAGSGMLRTSR